MNLLEHSQLGVCLAFDMYLDQLLHSCLQAVHALTLEYCNTHEVEQMYCSSYVKRNISI